MPSFADSPLSGSPAFFVSHKAAAVSKSEGVLECSLCPRRCILRTGETGSCRVRQNRDGKPALPFYGFVTALAKDPIEKKPLYHFRPGTEILSAGFSGCNLHCPFCQNWRISQNTDTDGRFLTPEELAAAALNTTKAIAYTYSEPLVHIEYLLACMSEARKAGAANVLVTNGCVTSEAAEEILSLTDAANIDLKCFSEETYSKILGGNLEAVLNFIRRAFEKKVHVELTTLVVSDLNDSEKELSACADFIAGLDTGIPWHLSAYHPDWKWKARATQPELLSEAKARAQKRLDYVYTGNIAAEENRTHCPHCGKILVNRTGYRIDNSGLILKEENGKPLYFCASCRKPAPIRY